MPGSGYEVTGPDGERLLYLPPGGAPAGLADGNGNGFGLGFTGADGGRAAYEMVLADVLGRPDGLARLRAAGAVGPTTDVIAVHIGHGAPPGGELTRRLAAAGARAVPDGTTLVVGAYEDVPDVPRRTLVLGGARSGKSVEAERRLEAFPEVLYVATGGTRNGDAEWADRVSLHRERRPGSWRTAETCDLVPLLADDGSPLLIDCLSLWLTHVMDEVNAWDDAEWAGGGERRLRGRVAELADAVRATRRTVVCVSNEVGSGIVPATASGRRYRDELGRLNAAFAPSASTCCSSWRDRRCRCAADPAPPFASAVLAPACDDPVGVGEADAGAQRGQEPVEELGEGEHRYGGPPRGAADREADPGRGPGAPGDVGPGQAASRKSARAPLRSAGTCEARRSARTTVKPSSASSARRLASGTRCRCRGWEYDGHHLPSSVA